MLFVLTGIFFLPCMKCKREKKELFFIKDICIWYSDRIVKPVGEMLCFII